MVTVTGGKWTTYRAMAQDVLEKCATTGLLPAGVSKSGKTDHLPLVGTDSTALSPRPLCDIEGWHSYGSEQGFVQTLAGHEVRLCEGLSEAMVRFAARHEYAVHVEDVLARRSRLLFLDARLAAQVAPRVAQILQQETGLDPALDKFLQLADQYALPVR
jgi:glycerol-3-phosphate dehydrogenase